MHEYGLCEAIMDAAVRRAEGRRVTEVTVRIGAMHRADEGALDQAFEMMATGTVAEDADLRLVVVPVTARCRSCGHRMRTDDLWSACERCGSGDLDTSGGDELLLESIRVESPSESPSEKGA